jgi:hypothetical protein
MTEDNERSRKQVVSIRLDVADHRRLQGLADEQDQSVSSLIGLAVRQFLQRFQEGSPTSFPMAEMKVRYTLLPDTCVLFAFHELAGEKFQAALSDLELPHLKFTEDRPEWRSLATDLVLGESHLVEALNRLPLFWHLDAGKSSPRLDWVGPFLEIFTGHHIFVRTDQVEAILTAADVQDYKEWAAKAKPGKEQSLHSLIGWAKTSATEKRQARAEKLHTLWENCLIGLQLGTDYHIAVRRVSPVLSKLSNPTEDSDLHSTETYRPILQGFEDLTRAYREFLNGPITGFTGHLLQTAELFAIGPSKAMLLAGPADLQVPSLNTLAGRKGLFDAFLAGDRNNTLGERVLALWSRAVTWFLDEVVMARTTDNLGKLAKLITAHQSTDPTEGLALDQTEKLRIFQSLMQTWVKWFPDAQEACSFMGDGVTSSAASPLAETQTLPSEQLVSHYQDLIKRLNPSRTMTAPDVNDAFWKFPVLISRPLDAAPSGGEAHRTLETRERTRG